MSELLLTLLLLITTTWCSAKKASECEVCVSALTTALSDLPSEDVNNADKIGEKIREYCGGVKGKEHKFCFYIGALPESATSIMKDVSKPLAYHMPPEKVCEKLSRLDAQICELKFDKSIDWKTVDLNKLRVKELKKILEDWGAHCKGCTEKSEFVSQIKELMPKFVKAEL